MERAHVKKSIDDWNDWLKLAVGSIITRTQDIVIPKQNALAITGVRRSGKSFQAANLSKTIDRTLYYNFEDPLFYGSPSLSDIDLLISVFTEYQNGSPELVIFDEIFHVPGWERWARKAVDLKRFSLIITGSSAKMLSSEISTSLTGRVRESIIWPLSFKEYCQFKNISIKHSSEFLGHIRDYLKWGGFPEVVLMNSDNEKQLILKQYLNDIVLKDVISRNEIRNKKALDQIIIYYFTNLSSLHSYSSLKKAFGIPTQTSADYTRYLTEAFTVFEVQRYHANLKVQHRDPKKIYIIDTGLRNVHNASRQEDLGKLAENVVYLQLRRNGCEISYYSNKGEVDFLVTELGVPTQAIQVCYSNLEDPSTYQREITSLKNCLQETQLTEGVILTLDREESLQVDNKTIQLIPLYKWLLEQKF